MKASAGQTNVQNPFKLFKCKIRSIQTNLMSYRYTLPSIQESTTLYAETRKLWSNFSYRYTLPTNQEYIQTVCHVVILCQLFRNQQLYLLRHVSYGQIFHIAILCQLTRNTYKLYVMSFYSVNYSGINNFIC